MKVKVYFTNNFVYEFEARDRRNAMEMGKRIIMEGAWIESNKDIEFYPVHTIYKVKIVKGEAK